MKKNLLYIVTKLELGGAQKHLLDLIRGLGQERYNIFLFTSADGMLCSEASSIPGLRVVFSKFLDRPLCLWRDAMVFCEMVFFIRKHAIDIVHTHSSKAGILGRWAARAAVTSAVVHTVHGWSFCDGQPGWVRDFFERLERWTAKITDKIIVVSSCDLGRGIERGIGKPEQYALIPCGIDPGRFRRECGDNSLKKELGFDEDVLLVGSIACLKKQKAPQDFLMLAHAVKPLAPGVKFLLVGDGGLKSEVLRMRERLGLAEDVFLLGWRRDIVRFLKALDVFVLTSHWEGLPVSVLEAMVSRKPVVVTDTGGVRDVVVEGRNGHLVPVGDIDKMRDVLLSLLRDGESRERLGSAAAGSLGENFLLHRTTEAVGRLYEGLV